MRLRFRFQDCRGMRLHVVEAGPETGPPVVLLHGFPEFWYGWRHQIDALAGAGYRVVMPDQRGYNLSDKPRGVAAYDLDLLAEDIGGLIDGLGQGPVRLAGHDWGGLVAWWLIGRYPEKLARAAILNCPHPAVWRQAMIHDPAQRKLSAYVRAFNLPLLPEYLMRCRNYDVLVKALKGSAMPLSADDEAEYRAAWAQPQALTSMVNWYRALIRRRLAIAIPEPRSLTVPTRLIWGACDKYVLPRLAEASRDLCAMGELIVRPQATHWIAHDEPETVNRLLLDFFG